MPRVGVSMPWNRTLCPGWGSPCPGNGPRAVAKHHADPNALWLSWHAEFWCGTRIPIPQEDLSSQILGPAWPRPPCTPTGSARGLGGCVFSWERSQVGARPRPGALKARSAELQPCPGSILVLPPCSLLPIPPLGCGGGSPSPRSGWGDSGQLARPRAEGAALSAAGTPHHIAI